MREAILTSDAQKQELPPALAQETPGQNTPQTQHKEAQETSSSATEISTQTLAWPEDVSFPPQAQESFAQLVHEMNLSAQQAQKLIDFEARFSRQAAQETSAHQTQLQEQWAQETKNFYGPKWEEAVSVAVRAADVFGGPELRALLETTGLGNHPVMVRTFNEIGKRICEDISLGGSAAVSPDKTFTEALYGNVTKGE